eukprot:SAG11_NODE_12088_length_722_cov_1.365971_1_plen_69_part_00
MIYHRTYSYQSIRSCIDAVAAARSQANRRVLDARRIAEERLESETARAVRGVQVRMREPNTRSHLDPR